MIQLTVTGRDARTTPSEPSEPITAGSVGLPVVLDLSSDFDGLAVTVCFEAGEAKADVAYLGDPVTVPLQCLTVVGAVLRIGVYGALPNGTIVIPTVWAIVGLVRKGAVPSGVDPSQPEPDWTAQVLAAARDAKETAERIEGEVDEWAEAEQARTTAEQGRADAEAARRSAEQARAGAESIRADAETQRVNAEGIRITNESARTSNELARTTAEQGRATAETGRALAETARAEAEQVRATAETARNGAEAARAQAEQQRADAERQRAASETARATAEQARATAETQRAAAESARAEAEQVRATAEQGRADAEGARSQAWAELEADVTAATDAATEAAAALKPEVTWLRGNQLTKELSGELMQASDAYGAPVLSLGVDGKSTQDGTPTPDAPVPIESVDGVALNFAGKNLLPMLYDTELTLYGITWHFDEQGRFWNKTGSAATSTRTVQFRTYDDVKWPAGNYVFCWTQVPSTSYGQTKGPTLHLIDADGNTRVLRDGSRPKIPFTLAEGERPDYFAFAIAAGSKYSNIIFSPMVYRADESSTWEPYKGITAQIPMQGHVLRSLPDDTRDTLALSYLRPSTREGWAWYSRTLTALVGETTTAATDGVTGTVGVDVMSTTGEIADGPTVLYKLAAPVTTQLDPVELPVLPAPNATVWSDPTTGLQMEYVRDTSIVIASLEAAYADLATS